MQRLGSFVADVQNVAEVLALGLTGAGTTQATATPLSGQENVITSAPAGGAFILQPVSPGLRVRVRNKDAANAATIYPPTGGQIDGYGTNVAVSLPSGSNIEFLCVSTTQWYA